MTSQRIQPVKHFSGNMDENLLVFGPPFPREALDHFPVSVERSGPVIGEAQVISIGSGAHCVVANDLGVSTGLATASQTCECEYKHRVENDACGRLRWGLTEHAGSVNRE